MIGSDDDDDDDDDDDTPEMFQITPIKRVTQILLVSHCI
jgi:hypothetical protein